MTTTSTDIVNEAIQLIGDNQPLVTGVAPTFDSSPAGVAASKLYTPTVQAVGRQFGWDFARNTVALTLSGNPAPNGWLYEYLYPGNAIELWQIQPPITGGTDVNNPLPVNWNVCNALVSAVQTKVIQCSVAGALGIYNNAPSEGLWDPLFHQAVVRTLAGALAMALEGRPDTAAAMLESGAKFEQVGEQRWD
jgi:hypothetical protein